MGNGKVVVAHRGARDDYQVAAAFAQAGLLERLVTDLYWAGDRPYGRWLGSFLPRNWTRSLDRRFRSDLPSRLVTRSPIRGLLTLLIEKTKRISFERRRKAVRALDAHLGRRAGKLARATDSLLLSYSYYGFSGFQSYRRPGALFQLHPHPLSVRKILQRELTDNPDCAASLEQEWELALPEVDFRRLVEETRLAHWFLAASSFTRRTLIENGAPAGRIHVVPYGVDLARFRPADELPPLTGPLRLLFVGTINQRKGIKYLLQALRLLPRGARVQLFVCGRAVDDLHLFKEFGSEVTLCLSPTEEELQAAYRFADFFVLPSLVEGFGHVLLEALASGVPIVSTTHTAAPDLITESGCEGFVVEPRRPDLLAARIDWALSHRLQLASMRGAARSRAEHFSWDRFRGGVVEAVRSFRDSSQTATNIDERRRSAAD